MTRYWWNSSTVPPRSLSPSSIGYTTKALCCDGAAGPSLAVRGRWGGRRVQPGVDECGQVLAGVPVGERGEPGAIDRAVPVLRHPVAQQREELRLAHPGADGFEQQRGA